MNNHLAFKKLILSVFAILAFVTIGTNFNLERIEPSLNSNKYANSANLMESSDKSGTTYEKDELLADVKNNPIQNALFLFNQIAFSFYRSSNVDYKIWGFDKDKNTACNLNSFYKVNHFVFIDIEIPLILKKQKISLCPIRARISHGPPFKQLS